MPTNLCNTSGVRGDENVNAGYGGEDNGTHEPDAHRRRNYEGDDFCEEENVEDSQNGWKDGLW